MWVRRLPWVRTCWPVLVLSVVQNVECERQHAERQPAGVVFGAELPEDVDSVVEPAVWDSAADDWVRGWVGCRGRVLCRRHRQLTVCFCVHTWVWAGCRR